MAISTTDVQGVARKFVDLSQMQIVVVGDTEKTRGVLKKYGKVQEVDVDGPSPAKPQSTRIFGNPYYRCADWSAVSDCDEEMLHTGITCELSAEI